MAEAPQFASGTALDAGCGEGGNAIWLAERGWRVTAVDISPTALRRARRHAESRGADVADRIDWVEADLTAWEPSRDHFDLVTAHYVHPAGSRQDLLHRLAAAVAPGGTLFVVEHDHADEHAPAHSSVDQLAASLDPEGWKIEVADPRVRRGTDPTAMRSPFATPSCEPATVHDLPMQSTAKNADLHQETHLSRTQLRGDRATRPGRFDAVAPMTGRPPRVHGHVHAGRVAAESSRRLTNDAASQ